MPIVPPAVQHEPDNFGLSRAQDFIKGGFRALATSVPFLDGAMAGPIFIATAPVAVVHRLRRLPRGCFPLKILNAAGTPTGVLLFVSATTDTVTLRQSAGGTGADYTLWVW
jgi:hypothetical protein